MRRIVQQEITVSINQYIFRPGNGSPSASTAAATAAVAASGCSSSDGSLRRTPTGDQK